jgi:beta-hydroxyacyl-ACP dehydratase FabZ
VVVDAISIQDILAILPHRFPFLLIDRVREISPDKIVAVKNVSIGEPYFQGHFPGQPIMPGVLQVEAMAQAGGILAAHSGDFDPKTQVVYFMTIDNVKFRRPVVPGDQLVIEVEPLRKGRVWKLKGQATVDGEVASQGEFLATMAPRTSAPAG